MTDNKLRKIYSRKNCIHMCYKGAVYAPFTRDESGDIVLVESTFTNNEQAYAEPEGTGKLLVTKANRSESEIWKEIDLHQLPRKNKAVPKSSTNREFDGMSFSEMIEAYEAKQENKRHKELGIPWYTMHISAEGSKTEYHTQTEYHPTYGISTMIEFEQFKKQYGVSKISELSDSIKKELHLKHKATALKLKNTSNQ